MSWVKTLQKLLSNMSFLRFEKLYVLQLVCLNDYTFLWKILTLQWLDACQLFGFISNWKLLKSVLNLDLSFIWNDIMIYL